MTVLDQQKESENIGIISAITYLLSIVFPRLLFIQFDILNYYWIIIIYIF